MDIGKIQELKKRYSEVDAKIIKTDATAKVVLKNVSDILKKYGIENIKEYNKIFELRDKKSLEAEELYSKVNNYLKDSSSKLSEIESIINS